MTRLTDVQCGSNHDLDICTCDRSRREVNQAIKDKTRVNVQERDRLRVQLTMIAMNSNKDDGSPLVSMNDKTRMIDKKNLVVWISLC